MRVLQVLSPSYPKVLVTSLTLLGNPYITWGCYSKQSLFLLTKFHHLVRYFFLNVEKHVVLGFSITMFRKIFRKIIKLLYHI
jgi:hypothetical protein